MTEDCPKPYVSLLESLEKDGADFRPSKPVVAGSSPAALTKFDRRTYVREWMRRRRAEWFAAHGPCLWCGSSERLEIDHIDPVVKLSNRVWSWSKSRRDIELDKCRVLCYDCHKKRHATGHGTKRMYLVHRCRCEACRHGHAIRRRAERSRQRERILIRTPAEVSNRVDSGRSVAETGTG